MLQWYHTLLLTESIETAIERSMIKVLITVHDLYEQATNKKPKETKEGRKEFIVN